MPHDTLLVQAGYARGAVAGLGVADALSVSIRTLAPAAADGAPVIVGTGEAGRSILCG